MTQVKQKTLYILSTVGKGGGPKFEELQKALSCCEFDPGASNELVRTRYYDKANSGTPEYSAIKSWLNSFENKEGYNTLRFFFFPSDTEASRTQACISQYYMDVVLKEALCAKGFSDCRCEICPSPLGVTEAQSFNKGIANLFERFDAIRKPMSPQDGMIINSTGGYKATTAYSVLYAQMHNLQSIYIFENQPEGISLLPLPISFDMDSLDEEVNIIKAIGQSDAQALRGFLDNSNLRPWVRSLMQDSGNASPLAGMLTRSLEEHKERGGAHGRAMLDLVYQHGQNEGWYDYLRQCVTEHWAELWIGDQIPETVEHSRRHSKRLMELGGYMLQAHCSVLEAQGLHKPFALALLVCAIFLHDIGHTVQIWPLEHAAAHKHDAFPLGLFPSCVREVHHLLSGAYIRQNEERLLPYPATGGPLSQADIDLLRQLVPLICEHHRGYTLLVEQKNKTLATPEGCIQPVGNLLFGSTAFAETLRPLRNRLHELGNIDAETQELALRVTAFLRILDGCDVQADRTVRPAYLSARLRRTQEEGQALYCQLLGFMNELRQRYPDMHKNVLKVHALNTGEVFCKTIAEGNKLDDDTSKKLKTLCQELYEAVMRELNTLKGDAENCSLQPCNIMAIHMLSLVNRYAFKWEQFRHFHKHRSVAFVMPLVREDGLVVTLWPTEDSDAVREALLDVKKDIEKEFTATQGLLENLQLQVENR